jgi:hypothetical protein
MSITGINRDSLSKFTEEDGGNWVLAVKDGILLAKKKGFCTWIDARINFSDYSLEHICRKVVENIDSFSDIRWRDKFLEKLQLRIIRINKLGRRPIPNIEIPEQLTREYWLRFISRPHQQEQLPNLSDVPKKFRDQNFYQKASQDLELFLRVPKDLLDESMCVGVVQQNGLLLHHVPYNLRTKEVCLAAVRNNGLSIVCVPGHLLSKKWNEKFYKKIYEAAVKNNELALAVVPTDLVLDNPRWRLLLYKGDDVFRNLRSLMSKLRDLEVNEALLLHFLSLPNERRGALQNSLNDSFDKKWDAVLDKSQLCETDNYEEECEVKQEVEEHIQQFGSRE